MPRPLQVYSAWPAYTTFPRDVLNLLEEPSHRQQATLYVAATSKAEASRLAQKVMGTDFPARVFEGDALSNDVRALQDKGYLLTREDLVVMPLDTHIGSPVALSTSGTPLRLIGRLIKNPDGSHKHILSEEI